MNNPPAAFDRDTERVRENAPALLMALVWLYSLEVADSADKRTDDFKQQKIMAIRAAERAIAAATGLEP